MLRSRPFLSWIARSARTQAASADEQLARAVKTRLPEGETSPPAQAAAQASMRPQAAASMAPAAFSPDAGQPTPTEEEIRRQISIDMGVPRFAVDAAIES